MEKERIQSRLIFKGFCLIMTVLSIGCQNDPISVSEKIGSQLPDKLWDYSNLIDYYRENYETKVLPESSVFGYVSESVFMYDSLFKKKVSLVLTIDKSMRNVTPQLIEDIWTWDYYISKDKINYQVIIEQNVSFNDRLKKYDSEWEVQVFKGGRSENVEPEFIVLIKYSEFHGSQYGRKVSWQIFNSIESIKNWDIDYSIYSSTLYESKVEPNVIEYFIRADFSDEEYIDRFSALANANYTELFFYTEDFQSLVGYNKITKRGSMTTYPTKEGDFEVIPVCWNSVFLNDDCTDFYLSNIIMDNF